MHELSAPKSPSFPALVQLFFTEYLVAQRAMSPRTIACYRDGLMLFLGFASRRLGRPPTALRLADIDPDLILAFLNHLEQQRHNSVRSRNLRLTALRAFLKFAARRDVLSLQIVERALSVPMKRFERPMLDFLTREEMLAVPRSARSLLDLATRSPPVCAPLQHRGTSLGDHRRARCRCGPRHRRVRASARQGTQATYGAAVEDDRQGAASLVAHDPSFQDESALLPNRDGHPMTRSNVEKRLDLAVARAIPQCRSLARKRVSPHTIRHTAAMHLLQSGVAFNVIALWLGHESPNTTHRYVEADLAMKEKALAQLAEPTTHLRRYRPPDALLSFLQQL